jgi:hypothetical protein
MTDNTINSAVASDLDTAMEDYSVDVKHTDGATGIGEYEYVNNDWGQNLGYYKEIPELRAVIDAKATWTVGKGFEADNETTGILSFFDGTGFDTFNTILENMIRTYNIGGDAFAEIIFNDEDEFENLKILDPSSIKIISDEYGIIKRYEQISKVEGEDPKKFKPEKIFHLARNRVADEIHGVSMIESLKDIILMKNEAMSDYKTVMHRFVKPQWKFKLNTDDPDEIKEYKAKQDAATGAGENIYEPMDVSDAELIAVAPNATLNPIAWIQYLDKMFYEVAQVPKIILGGSGEFTEASAKIAYLAFQQTIEEEQLFIEEQIFNQLGLTIDLEFPASLENELLSDNKKDGAQNIDASETTAGEGQ